MALREALTEREEVTEAVPLLLAASTREVLPEGLTLAEPETLTVLLLLREALLL